MPRLHDAYAFVQCRAQHAGAACCNSGQSSDVLLGLMGGGVHLEWSGLQSLVAAQNRLVGRLQPAVWLKTAVPVCTPARPPPAHSTAALPPSTCCVKQSTVGTRHAQSRGGPPDVIAAACARGVCVWEKTREKSGASLARMMHKGRGLGQTHMSKGTAHASPTSARYKEHHYMPWGERESRAAHASTEPQEQTSVLAALRWGLTSGAAKRLTRTAAQAAGVLIRGQERGDKGMSTNHQCISRAVP